MEQRNRYALIAYAQSIGYVRERITELRNAAEEIEGKGVEYALLSIAIDLLDLAEVILRKQSAKRETAAEQAFRSVKGEIE
ncbi:MAG: hypothetical protein IJP98_02360 [Clostridia bacterium]|nr:hypothetical protein [Clostridia bacterium]